MRFVVEGLDHQEIAAEGFSDVGELAVVHGGVDDFGGEDFADGAEP